MLSSYVKMFEDEIARVSYSDDIVTKYSESSRAIIYKTPDGSKIVANMWGTRERIARALKIDEEDIEKNLLEALKNPMVCKQLEDPPLLKNSSENFDLRNIAEVSHGLLMSEKGMKFTELTIAGKNIAYTDFLDGENVNVVFGLCPAILLPAIANMSLDVASSFRYRTLGESVYIHVRHGITIPAYAEAMLEGKVKENPKRRNLVRFKKFFNKKEPLLQIITPKEHELLKNISRNVLRKINYRNL